MTSIIIPAHNEATVIARTLETLHPGVVSREIEVIVVCNGCNDKTAEVCRGFAGVTVIETAEAGKTNALNIGDATASSFPRIYLDADIVITLACIREVSTVLTSERALLAAPTAINRTDSSSWAVKQFYGIADNLSFAKEGVGTSGVYAMSESGRRRFSLFPKVISDDGFVRIQFEPAERLTLKTQYSIVSTPRNLRSLIAIKTRSYLGTYELIQLYPQLWSNSGRTNTSSLIKLMRRPRNWLGVSIYVYATIRARAAARDRFRNNVKSWDRDHSSREAEERL